MVQMALFYSHYCHPWAGKPSQPVEHVVTGSPKGVCQEFGGWCPSNSTEISSPYMLIQRKYGVNLYQLCYKSTINLHVVSTPIFIKSTFMGHNKKWVHAWPIPTCRMAHILVPAFHGGHRDGAAWGWLEVPRDSVGFRAMHPIQVLWQWYIISPSFVLECSWCCHFWKTRTAIALPVCILQEGNRIHWLIT